MLSSASSRGTICCFAYSVMTSNLLTHVITVFSLQWLVICAYVAWLSMNLNTLISWQLKLCLHTWKKISKSRVVIGNSAFYHDISICCKSFDFCYDFVYDVIIDKALKAERNTSIFRCLTDFSLNNKSILVCDFEFCLLFQYFRSSFFHTIFRSICWNPELW